jgi:hypothetical protein
MNVLNEKTLVQRINRKLDGERLKLCRYDSPSFNELGRYYVIDNYNCLVSKDIDIQDYAKELSVI